MWLAVSRSGKLGEGESWTWSRQEIGLRDITEASVGLFGTSCASSAAPSASPADSRKRS